MAESLGTALPGQLLALMAFPACGAIFFAILIAYSVSKRKKAKMKLGIQPRQDAAVPQSPAKGSGPAYDLDTSVLSHSTHVSKPATGPKPDLLEAEPKLAETKPVPQPPPPLKPASPMLEEKVDLAVRLGAQPPAAPAPAGPAELLRLLRQPDSGQLIVEVAGQQFSKLTDIPDKEIGEYILKLAANLLSFTNGMIETEAGLKSVYNPRLDTAPEPLTPPPPVSQKPAITVPPSQPVQPERPPAEASFIPKPPPEAQAALLAALQTQTTQPSTPPPRRGLLGRTRTSAQPILPGLNLAEEINKIVQARLAISPLATTTKIDITGDPGGGIRIKVDGIPYASPDDVPDAEARELIKASIKQWERS